MYNFLIDLLYGIPAIIIAFTVHEFAHGISAYWLGDKTAKYDGRLSLNPIHHIDPIGFICLIVLKFGWAKPVMVNPGNFDNPKMDMALTAFAGPFSNLLLAFISALIIYPVFIFSGDSLTGHIVVKFLGVCMSVNISLCIFNMIPLPPFDGSKVFGAVLPDTAYFNFISNHQLGFIALIAIIVLDAFNDVYSSLLSTIANGIMFLVDKIYFFL